MNSTVRRMQLIAPATVTLLVAMAAVVTVAAVAQPDKSVALPGEVACVPVAAVAQPDKSVALPGEVACVPVAGSTGGALDSAQERNAKVVIGVALPGGWVRRGRRSGCRSLAESTLFNYANDGTSTLVGSAEGRQLNDSERAVARESLAFPPDRVGNKPGLDRAVPAAADDRLGHPGGVDRPAHGGGEVLRPAGPGPGVAGHAPRGTRPRRCKGSPSSDGGIHCDIYQ